MKNWILVVLLSMPLLSLSQTKMTHSQAEVEQEAFTPKAYLGLSAGLNHISGLAGVNLDLALSRQFMLGVGAGLGSWGTKMGFSGKYYPNDELKKMFFEAGFCTASGISRIDMDFNVNGSVERVPLKFNRVNNLNLGVGYTFLLGSSKKTRFNLFGGYSVLLSNSNNAWSVLDGKTISDSSRQFVNFMIPGGLWLGASMCFSVTN